MEPPGSIDDCWMVHEEKLLAKQQSLSSASFVIAAGCPGDVQMGRLRRGISTVRGVWLAQLLRRFQQTKLCRLLLEICNRSHRPFGSSVPGPHHPRTEPTAKD